MMEMTINAHPTGVTVELDMFSSMVGTEDDFVSQITSAFFHILKQDNLMKMQIVKIIN